jgi:hypothetical protein
MRSESQAGLPTQPSRTDVTGAAAALRTVASTLEPLADGIQSAVGRVRAELVGDVQAIGEIAKGVSVEKLGEWAAALGRHQESKEWTDRLEAADNAASALAGGRLDPLTLVPGAASALRSFSSGVTLQRFLQDQAAGARGNLDIYVTGHSKGGALCTAVAAWLVDTQGTESVPLADQWDPQRSARVHAYAFAGPTPGNSAFARHVDAILGGRCHRIFNRLDLAPHAFAAGDLAMIPRLYDLAQVEQKLLDGLAAQLIGAVKTLDYRHAGADSTELRGQLAGGLPLVAQAIHQHLDGYLQQMGLGAEMSVRTFFGEL